MKLIARSLETNSSIGRDSPYDHHGVSQNSIRLHWKVSYISYFYIYIVFVLSHAFFKMFFFFLVILFYYYMYNLIYDYWG